MYKHAYAIDVVYMFTLEGAAACLLFLFRAMTLSSWHFSLGAREFKDIAQPP